jgi:hypothetical protein
MKRSQIRKVNPKRKRARFEAAYGSQANVERIRALPCVICGRTPSEAAHVRSRGAGGTWRDIVPLCTTHHRMQHDMGIRSFERHYGVDLAELAADINHEENTP